MKNKYKITLILLIFIIGFLVWFKYALMINGTSLSKAEYYKFNLTKNELIEAINIFKEQHPEFTIKNNKSYNDKDGGNWNYFVYFRFSNENIVIRTIVHDIRGLEPKISYIGFVTIDYQNDSNNKSSKSINIDLDEEENNKLIKLFEGRIIKPLRLQIENVTDKK